MDGLSGIEIMGQSNANPPIRSANLISPQYFATLRIPILQGRIWSETENSKGAHLAVINRALAQLVFPHGDAIGHSLRLPGIEGNPATVLYPPNIGASWLQIIGVVWRCFPTDVIKVVPRPAVYVPYTLSMGGGGWPPPPPTHTHTHTPPPPPLTPRPPPPPTLPAFTPPPPRVTTHVACYITCYFFCYTLVTYRALFFFFFLSTTAFSYTNFFFFSCSPHHHTFFFFFFWSAPPTVLY